MNLANWRTGAHLSQDDIYRYSLWRAWEKERDHMVFVMLNPSSADASHNDPTIIRCMSFAKREGFGGIQVINLFALRTAKPEDLLTHPNPQGSDNTVAWEGILEFFHRGPFVAAWGANVSKLNERGVSSDVLSGVDTSSWKCFGHNLDGSPKHPLYIHGDAPLVPYERENT